MYSARDSAGCTNDVEYIVVVHVSRLSDFWRVMQEHVNMAFNRTQWGRFQVVTNFGRDCLVDQCNAGQLAAQGEIILDNQDDMRYPEHWDTEISKLIPDTSQAICIQARTDGARKDLLTIPGIQTRALMRKIGQHCPEYDGMFADDEWSAKAWLLADDVRKSSLYFEHLHPVNKTSEMDSVYVQENREQAYRSGWEVFQRRKAAGFPRIPFPDEITPAESPNVVQKALAGSRISWRLRNPHRLPPKTLLPSARLVSLSRSDGWKHSKSQLPLRSRKVHLQALHGPLVERLPYPAGPLRKSHR